MGKVWWKVSWKVLGLGSWGGVREGGGMVVGWVWGLGGVGGGLGWRWCVLRHCFVMTSKPSRAPRLPISLLSKDHNQFNQRKKINNVRKKKNV